jgi:membrane protein implicated in regulation of membrane protease activity
MMLKKFFALFLFLVAISLLAYGIFSLSFDNLLRMLAVSLGISLLFLIFYPRLRGVRKGDEVVVVTHSYVPSFLGRKGKIVKIAKNYVIVELEESGKEVTGVIESYEGLLSPPRVRIIYEEQIIK